MIIDVEGIEERIRAIKKAGIITSVLGQGTRWVLDIYLPFRPSLGKETFSRERDARKAARLVEIAYKAGYDEGCRAAERSALAAMDWVPEATRNVQISYTVKP